MVTDRLNSFTLELSEHLAQTIRGEVKTTVNGKIDALSLKIEPLLLTFENLKWGEKILVKIGIFVGGFITAIWSIIEIIKFFTNFKK